MKIALFGATGAVGRECLTQSLEAGHDVRVLARSPAKLPEALRSRVDVVEGDGLDAGDVDRTIEGADVVLFAIGVDQHSPEDLCTNSTALILEVMRKHGARRLVWCGGGSNFVEEDVLTFGARFVNLYARLFLRLRHEDKEHQYALLQQNRDVEWLGVRPLQIRDAPLRGEYRLGFHAFSPSSWVSFADVGHAMVSMIDGDEWIHRAPILQY